MSRISVTVYALNKDAQLVYGYMTRWGLGCLNQKSWCPGISAKWARSLVMTEEGSTASQLQSDNASSVAWCCTSADIRQTTPDAW